MLFDVLSKFDAKFLFPLQVFQLLELPKETERLETYQALLVTKRVIFLDRIYNSSAEANYTEFYEVCGI